MYWRDVNNPQRNARYSLRGFLKEKKMKLRKFDGKLDAAMDAHYTKTSEFASDSQIAEIVCELGNERDAKGKSNEKIESLLIAADALVAAQSELDRVSAEFNVEMENFSARVVSKL